VVAYDAREYDRAIESFRKTLQLDPSFFVAKLFLACAYVSAGKSAEGLAQLEKLEQLPELRNAKLELLALRAWMLSTKGDKAAAARVVKELDSRSSEHKMHTALLAAMQSLVGNKDGAFALLDNAIAERDPMVRDLKVSPMWDPLRNDPRFGKMLKRLNLD
jgi:serine/threonine-protein kinase